MYEKFGFKIIDGFEMEIPRPEIAEGGSQVYRETCMVWQPVSKQNGRSDVEA